MHRAGRLQAVLLGSASLSCPAAAASFDCAKASQPDARAFLSRRHGCGADAACLTSADVGAIEDFGHRAAATPSSCA